METKSSKLYGVLDINLWHKYRDDLFFRTTCHIILLQMVMTAVLIGIFWYTLQYLGRGVATEFLHYVQVLISGGDLAGGDFTTTLDTITTEQFYMAATIVVATTLCFAFITTYVALTPTRRSLERKKRFINNIAHELRTPLAVVRTNTEVLLFDKNLSSEVTKTLNENVHELDRISHILNNLLTLSSVMRADQMKFEHVDLGTIAERAVTSLMPIADQKHIRLVLEKGTSRLISGNAVALEQVVFNLTRNALNHTNEGGTVTVTVQAGTYGYIDLSVKDTGTGIPTEDLGHIFEPFYRSKRAPKGVGSGLGLTIVSEIVQIHRGKIVIQSREGQGTTVTVAIPQMYSRDNRVQQTVGDAVSVDYSKTLLRD